jgi:hypothetical protein
MQELEAVAAAASDVSNEAAGADSLHICRPHGGFAKRWRVVGPDQSMDSAPDDGAWGSS